jgi:HSP20 family protein
MNCMTNNAAVCDAADAKYAPEDLPRAAPFTDIYETPNAFVLEVELPAVSEKDLSVKVEENALVIEGFSRAGDLGDRALRHREFTPSRFRRSFQLPMEARHDGIEARLAEGVLTISLAKADEARPREIPVRVQA